MHLSGATGANMKIAHPARWAKVQVFINYSLLFFMIVLIIRIALIGMIIIVRLVCSIVRIMLIGVVIYLLLHMRVT